MMLTTYFAIDSVDTNRLNDIFKGFGGTLFDGKSLLILLVCLLAAGLLSNIATRILRHFSQVLRQSSRDSKSRKTATRFRRIETWVVLSIAIVKFISFVIALYVWWVLVRPTDSHPTILIGASAFIAIVIGGIVGPLLRDFAYGSGMMAEQWYAVGDLVTIEPFANMRGVVERITLRSTRIRGLNGEVIWISNQSIAAVRVARKGVTSIAIELFVRDYKAAAKLVDDVNNLLPTGHTLVAEKLTVVQESERAGGIWHVTALGETAPGREWILQETAVDLLKKIDEAKKKPILVADPVARFADSETERGFELAVSNAKKKQTSFDYRRLMTRRRSRRGEQVLSKSDKSDSNTQLK